MIKYTTLVCPGAGAETSVYRLKLRLRLHNTAGESPFCVWMYVATYRPSPSSLFQ
jgi:hypothetical protein